MPVAPHGETTVRPVRSSDEIQAVRGLFGEYERWLAEIGHCHDLSGEAATLPGAYAPPSGALLIAHVKDEVAGCIALRRLKEQAAELKRFYVRPAYRGFGVGRRLLESAIGAASNCGFSLLRLDSLETKMAAAAALYRAAGFHQIPPYDGDGPRGRIFFELRLCDGPSGLET